MYNYNPFSYNLPAPQPIYTARVVGPEPTTKPKAVSKSKRHVFISKMEGALKKAVDVVEDVGSTVVRKEVQQRFLSLFNLPQEIVRNDFRCKVISQTDSVRCHVFLTHNCFCFRMKKGTSSCSVTLPYQNIVSWQKMDYDEEKPPELRHLPLQNPQTMIGNSIHVFSDDGRVHIFVDFFHYDRFWNTFDILWRKKKQQVQQQQPQQVFVTAPSAPPPPPYNPELDLPPEEAKLIESAPSLPQKP